MKTRRFKHHTFSNYIVTFTIGVLADFLYVTAETLCSKNVGQKPKLPLKTAFEVWEKSAVVLKSKESNQDESNSRECFQKEW